MKILLHKNDLPSDLKLGPKVAIDTETMGLNVHRDRLCLVQLTDGSGTCHIVQFTKEHAESIPYKSPHLKKLMNDSKITKIFHFARFDVAMMEYYLGVTCAPIFCTKIAARLTRTFTNRHGLKDICKDLLGIDISKEQQSSDWGAPTLKKEQLEYAAQDVLYLHQLEQKFSDLLKREKRDKIAQACFEFLPTRAKLDILGWEEEDIFSHSSGK